MCVCVCVSVVMRSGCAGEGWLVCKVKTLYTRSVTTSQQLIDMVNSGNAAYDWANSPNVVGRLVQQREAALAKLEPFDRG